MHGLAMASMPPTNARRICIGNSVGSGEPFGGKRAEDAMAKAIAGDRGGPGRANGLEERLGELEVGRALLTLLEVLDHTLLFGVGNDAVEKRPELPDYGLTDGSFWHD